jgi:hypothetical protein
VGERHDRVSVGGIVWDREATRFGLEIERRLRNKPKTKKRKKEKEKKSQRLDHNAAFYCIDACRL